MLFDKVMYQPIAVVSVEIFIVYEGRANIPVYAFVNVVVELEILLIGVS